MLLHFHFKILISKRQKNKDFKNAVSKLANSFIKENFLGFSFHKLLCHCNTSYISVTKGCHFYTNIIHHEAEFRNPLFYSSNTIRPDHKTES